MYSNPFISQNVPAPALRYPTYNNQYQPEASGANAVAPLSHLGHITNNDPSQNPYANRFENRSGFQAKHCPKLTDFELNLLNDHKGWRKCR